MSSSSTRLKSFLTGVKVSDSFRVLRTDDYIWSQLNEKRQCSFCLSHLLSQSIANYIYKGDLSVCCQGKNPVQLLTI